MLKNFLLLMKFIITMMLYTASLYLTILKRLKKIQKKKIKPSKLMHDMIVKGSKISKKKYLHSLSCQQNLCSRFDEEMKKFDFLVTPSTASVATLIGIKEKNDTSLIWTFLGAPSISLPVFFDAKKKLPFGLLVVARRYDDFNLLDFSKKILN